MGHIFISYSHDDLETVRELRHALLDRGFAIWMDETKIRGGDEWWAVIEQHIKEAQLLIVVMSPTAKSSEWVQRELEVARGNSKTIIPVLLSGKPWPSLRTIHYVDMSSGITPAFLLNLISGIQSNLGKHQRKNWLTEPIAIIIAAIIGLVAVILGALIQNGYFSPQRSQIPTSEVRVTTQGTDTSSTRLPSGATSAAVTLEANLSSRCWGKYAEPAASFSPVLRFTSSKNFLYLWPVPSDAKADIENPAMHPSIQPGQKLGIIGKTINTSTWLYVEMAQENQVTKYGFIKLEHTDFTGNLSEFPDIKVPFC